MLYQEPMFRQVESGVQNGFITENGVLPVTTLFQGRRNGFQSGGAMKH